MIANHRIQCYLHNCQLFHFMLQLKQCAGTHDTFFVTAPRLALNINTLHAACTRAMELHMHTHTPFCTEFCACGFFFRRRHFAHTHENGRAHMHRSTRHVSAGRARALMPMCINVVRSLTQRVVVRGGALLCREFGFIFSRIFGARCAAEFGAARRIHTQCTSS